MRILLVEDDRLIGDGIKAGLSKMGFSVDWFTDGKTGQAALYTAPYDAVVLDLTLPEIDGLEILRAWRESGKSEPVLILTARDALNQRVEGLRLGADDYLTKPIGTSELLARIRTALRHSNRLNTASPLYKRPFHAKGLTIDFEKHLVSVDGRDVHLTQIEFKIISLLAQNSGRVMTYDTIISNIWGPYADDDNSILRVNMAHIRRKLEQNPAEPQYVFTEIGIGYRMIEDEMQ